MNIGECMEYAQKLCDAKSSSERIEARKELRAAIAATVKEETDHLARELAEAKARAVRGQAESLLKVLVEALDSSFISSWQSTAGWQSQLDAAREWLAARPELPKESENE